MTPNSSTSAEIVASAARCTFIVDPPRVYAAPLLARSREDLLVCRRLSRRRNHLHEVGVGRHQSQSELVAGHPRLRVRLWVVDRDGELQRVLVDTVVALLHFHVIAVRVAR